MVFQDYTSFDNRTVEDNVAFGLECRGVGARERRERRASGSRKVGLDVKRDAHKYPSELSGGMRQRVAIARTLILSPRIILMDEPFGALDPTTRLHMQELLVDLWREAQATVFFVTHSIEEAVYLGDRVYVFSSAPGTILREMAVPQPTGRPRRCCASRRSSSGSARSATSSTRWSRRRGPAMTDAWRTSFLRRSRPIGPRSRRRAPGCKDYLKEAFLFRWNLLLFLGGPPARRSRRCRSAAAAGRRRRADLSGRAGLDAALPRGDRREGPRRAGKRPPRRRRRRHRRSSTMLGGLPAEARKRFERLHARCLEMRTHRRRRARRGGAQAGPPRRSARPGSIGCSGCSCACWCRRPRSIGSCRR